MADRREMLARLNPQIVRFDVGQGGGAPSLTTSDIAAALGIVPAGLGREVMETVYLPNGALRHRQKLAEAVLAIVRPEFTRRARALANAEADLELVQAIVSLGRRGMSEAQCRALQQRKVAVAQARAAAWPRDTYQHLSRMVDAVVQELASGNHCGNCRGTGRVSEKACPECRCTGIEPLPDRRRALALGCGSLGVPEALEARVRVVAGGAAPGRRSGSTQVFPRTKQLRLRSRGTGCIGLQMWCCWAHALACRIHIIARLGRRPKTCSGFSHVGAQVNCPRGRIAASIRTTHGSF